MTSRDGTKRTTTDGQLRFDWNSGNTNDNQPLTPLSPTIPGTPSEARDEDSGTTSPQSDSSKPCAAVSDGGYEPGHPWHYYRDGDCAPPIPFDEIPPAEDYGPSLERDLPKPAAKRIIKARQLLVSERRGLDEARGHYEDVIARGAEALSRYDREIAYGGNDEMARAGTLALLFNQIAWRRGRIAYLERLQSQRTR